MKNNKKAVINFDIPEIKKLEPMCLNLLKKMLILDPSDRISPEEALNHCYFDDYQKYKTKISLKSDEDSQAYLVDETDENTNVANQMIKMDSINLVNKF